MHSVDTYPSDKPASITKRKNAMSEFMVGEEVNDGAGPPLRENSTLHRRNKGMNAVRAREMPRSLRDDHMARRGLMQRTLPSQAEMFHMRK